MMLAACFLDRTTSNWAELPAHAVPHTHTALEGAKQGNAQFKKKKVERVERGNKIVVNLPE